MYFYGLNSAVVNTSFRFAILQKVVFIWCFGQGRKQIKINRERNRLILKKNFVPKRIFNFSKCYFTTLPPTPPFQYNLQSTLLFATPGSSLAKRCPIILLFNCLSAILNIQIKNSSILSHIFLTPRNLIFLISF